MKTKYSKGQTAVIIALVLPVIVGAVALGADFAVMYFNWLQLQKAADSGALAGAGYLPNDTTDANTAATSYAQMNGRTGDTINVTVDGSSFPSWVEVRMSRQVPYFFGRVLGLTNATLNVTARAGITSVSGSNGQGGHTLPIWIDCPTGQSCPGTLGTTISLNLGGSSGSYGAGNWGILQLPGMSNSNGKPYMENLTKTGWVSPDPTNPLDNITYNPDGQPGCTVSSWCMPVNTGNAALQGAVAGIQDRITQGSANYPSDNPVPPSVGPPTTTPNANDPRVVIIPVVNATGVTGASTPVPILNLATVFLDSVSQTGPQSWVLNLTFVQVDPNGGGVPGGTTQTCVQGVAGVCTVVLEQ